MLVSNRKKGLVSFLNGFVVDLPSPSGLSYFWNFGSLLGLFMGFQIISGLFLSFHFSSDLMISFFSVIKIMRDVGWGWLVRFLHANGASMYFMFMYVHIGRGIYYGSYRFYKVWGVGVLIFLVSMMVAFLGYVLPWGQMSYWAATVITNLLSVVPYVGGVLVEWVWGGFSVGNPTLIRFFSFHFIFPFVLLVMVLLHLYFLHESGSNNPLGISGEGDKLGFYLYYAIKDVCGIFLVMIVFSYFCLLNPYLFMDSENFIYYNPMVTPVHIQPEWYFLFAYAILRSVPSKVGGVMALLGSVLILFVIPFAMTHLVRSTCFYGVVKGVFWMFVVSWICLSWLGSCEVEYPFDLLAKIFSVLYFMGFFNMSMLVEVQDKLLDWL